MKVPRSRLAGAAALFLAAAAHAGTAFLTDTGQAEQAGGQTGLAAAGIAFADLAQGTDAPVKAEDVLEAEHPMQDAPRKPAPETQQPVAPTAAKPAAVPNTEPALPSRQAQPVKQTPAGQPAKPPAQQPLPEAKPDPARQPQPKPRKAAPRGNSDQNAAQGTAAGRAAKPAGQATQSPGTAKQQGNAAADNYRGQVLRRVMRAKRQRVSIRGAALVRFSIAADGSLRTASIAKSSGSAKLDSIALAQVRRAAPFPAPPAGAGTTYTVRIKGK
ncbi:energy transducer TonB [Leisingera sp. HS039]|uniref:energy transducer TonB n=1 Tax=unclassified Leisingera TaxID=2614906 RepID=UPI001070D88B|nr:MULTISPECIES: TonB family protein [unclassified Leisingera]MBQ4824501.1 energy transducer TonB [Leisingera sp. HS039]QBR38851.1 energy transducer TonB [Leisingera sp. NJS201]